MHVKLNCSVVIEYERSIRLTLTVQQSQVQNLFSTIFIFTQQFQIMQPPSPWEAVKSVSRRRPRIRLRAPLLSPLGSPTSCDVNRWPWFLQLPRLLYYTLNPLRTLIVHTPSTNRLAEFLKLIYMCILWKFDWNTAVPEGQPMENVACHKDSTAPRNKGSFIWMPPCDSKTYFFWVASHWLVNSSHLWNRLFYCIFQLGFCLCMIPTRVSSENVIFL